MIGIIVATHGAMARGLIDAAEMILGPQPRVAALPIGRRDGPDDIRRRYSAAIAAVQPTDEDGGVLILADMFGGTPANIGLSFMERTRLEVLTGVNLPMLLKACNARVNLPLEELALEVKEYALNGILLVSQLMKDSHGRS